MKRLICILLSIAMPSWGAVTLDTQAQAACGQNNNTCGVAITIGTGHSNTCLVALCAMQDTGTVAFTTQTGGGATWSAAFATGTGLGSFKGAIYSGLTPSTGAQTVVCNDNGNGTTTPSGPQSITVYSLYNCNQTTPLAGAVFTTSGNQVINVTSGDMAISADTDLNNNRTVSGCTTTTDSTGFTSAGFSDAHCTASPTSTFTWSGFFATGSIAEGVDVQQVSAGGATPTGKCKQCRLDQMDQ